MESRKIICIILALILGLSLFASGAFARASCNEGHCKHLNMNRSQMTAMANIAFEGPPCCAGVQEGPCDFVKAQSSERYNGTISPIRVNRENPSHLYVTGSNPMPEVLSVMASGPRPKDRPEILSSPIYLRHGSLIC